VALYFENSIAAVDWALLGASSSVVENVENTNGTLAVESRHGVGVAWTGPAMVDGRAWPVRGTNFLWLPPGTHSVKSSTADVALRLIDLNADLRSATALPNGVEFVYQSPARTLALFDREPAAVEIDGEPLKGAIEGKLVKLPRGQHIATVTLGPDTRSAR
jgi:hypothetical protein